VNKYNIGDLIISLYHADVDAHATLLIAEYFCLGPNPYQSIYKVICSVDHIPTMDLYEEDIDYHIVHGDYIYYPVIRGNSDEI
jgi:hypothetical protein